MSFSAESVQGVLVQIVFGCITAYLAKERGRSPPIWFLVGFFAGIIGLVVLLLFPSMLVSGKKIAEPMPGPIAAPPPLAEPEMTGWFYLDEQYQPSGPHPFSLIIARWQLHELDRSSYLWREGMPDWQKVEELPEVIAKLEPETPPS